MSQAEVQALDKAVVARGVTVGVASVLETRDQFVLLTKRAPHMRTFPNCWVPPGGHIDKGETLFEAALRELREETGLSLSTTTEVAEMRVLGIREGAYPVALAHGGTPRRHHIIVYVYLRVAPFRIDLNQRMCLNPEEVSGCTWLTRGLVLNIRADRVRTGFRRENQATMVNSAGKHWSEPVDVAQLLQERVGDFGAGGCLSTGTKFALDLWLAIKEQT